MQFRKCRYCRDFFELLFSVLRQKLFSHLECKYREHQRLFLFS